MKIRENTEKNFPGQQNFLTARMVEDLRDRRGTALRVTDLDALTTHAAVEKVLRDGCASKVQRGMIQTTSTGIVDYVVEGPGLG